MHTFLENSKSIYNEITQKLRTDYGKRKAGSVKYSNQKTHYFQSLIVEAANAQPNRKTEIERILKQAKEQQNCSIHIEHILASGPDHSKENGSKVEKRLLRNRRCRSRKTCQICAALDGLKRVEQLVSYFNENEDLIAIPFTISPRNYKKDNLRDTVRKAQEQTERLYNNFKEATKKRKNGKVRGTAGAQLAISQLKENMVASYWSKEFEPGKEDSDSVNAHWHGMFFMKLDQSGSYKKTLCYDSFKKLIDWANGEQCQVKIGDTKNGNKPITHSKDATKAFLEVTKYITKIPTKESDKAFKARQALIWEVYAATYRKNFIKLSGELLSYRAPQDISLWTPEDVKHHELSIGTNHEYHEHITDISPEFINAYWFELIKLEDRRDELFHTEQKLDRTRDEKKAKNLRTFIKGLHTTIERLEARIQYKEHCQMMKNKAG